jgi:hypothetical protein
VVDNAVTLAVPGAMDARLADPLFWGSLALALAVWRPPPPSRWAAGRSRAGGGMPW